MKYRLWVHAVECIKCGWVDEIHTDQICPNCGCNPSWDKIKIVKDPYNTEAEYDLSTKRSRTDMKSIPLNIVKAKEDAKT